MKKILWVSAACLASVCLTIGGTATAANPIGTCSEAQLRAESALPQDAEVHRRFTMPALQYPFGTVRPDWGFVLRLIVDADGKPICYNALTNFGRPQLLDETRRAILSDVTSWRYAPFLVDGQPVKAAIYERIGEEEMPKAKTVLAPSAKPENTRFRLERTACLGECPIYSVDISGDGHVTYKGIANVDVVGTQVYQVPSEEASKLPGSMVGKQMWGLRSAYRASITDQPSAILTMDIDGNIHRLTDYAGELAGMPASVSRFEDEIDTVSRSAMWINLTEDTVRRLESKVFDFGSEEGTALFRRAITNRRTTDDVALVRLIQLGVLTTEGKLDQAKIDDAFLHAIKSMRFEVVKAIWQISDGTRPSLVFIDEDKLSKPLVRRSAPVCLLIEPHKQNYRSWQGEEITRWMQEKGCDIGGRRADGSTLISEAVAADDVSFMRFLVSLGLNVNAPGKYDLLPISSATSEDMALALLEAGATVPPPDNDGTSLHGYAENAGWSKVLAWLASH